jgi:hypothetical protein
MAPSVARESTLNCNSKGVLEPEGQRVYHPGRRQS